MPGPALAASGKGLPTNKLTDAAEVAGVLKQISSAFTAYKVARNTFVNTLSGLLQKPDGDNVSLEAMMKEDVMAVLCCPLAQDSSPGIQTTALQCLAKLAARDPLLSQVVVSCGALDSIIVSMAHESPPVQCAADSVLASVGRKTVDFAHRILAAGALPSLAMQLQKGNAAVQEAAVVTLNSLVQNAEEHATVICDENMLTSLVALLQVEESPSSLCKAIVHVLGNAAFYNETLAGAVVKAQALPQLSGLLGRGSGTPADLRAACFNCLAQIARHQADLAGQVAASGVVPVAVQSLTDKMTASVRRCAAAMLLELTRKTPELASTVTRDGAPACLLKYLQLEQNGGEGREAGIMIAGQLSMFQPSVAKAVIDAGVSVEVVGAVPSTDVGVSGTAAWALEQMAQHGTDNTMPLIEQGALRVLIEASPRSAGVASTSGHSDGSAAGERHQKVKSAIKALIRGCNNPGALEVFVGPKTPASVLPHLLRRLHPLLKDNPKARQQFVTTGALQRMQQQEAELGAKGAADVAAVNALFPDDVVNYYR